MKQEIFRAYDIRGKYPEEINEDVAFRLGKSYGSYLQEIYHEKSCILSHDNRISSGSLLKNLIKGILSSGCNVINYGLTTTPMNYYARYFTGLPGIMITASHNPKDDNGFKFSFDGMINARGEMITNFKNYTLIGQFLEGKGTYEEKNIFDNYMEYLLSNIDLGKRRLKVIIDCGNGVTCTIARKIFSKFNIDFEIINEENDGTFPNHHPDPSVKENMIQLQNEVIKQNADLGIAFDGDGDRVGIVLENGEVMPIEHYMLTIIKDMIGSVDTKTFLYDIKCSKCMEDEITKIGGKSYCYRTGASYTQYKTMEEDLPFGAEYSGHIYFRDRASDCGSAIYAALRLVEILSKTNKKLSELCQDIPKYYSSEEIRIASTENKKFEVAEKIKQFAKNKNYSLNDIDGVRINFTNGWVLVRASNTGGNITFRAEAETKEHLKTLENLFLPLIDEYNKDK